MNAMNRAGDRFSCDGLTIEVTTVQSIVHVVWRGVSEARDPDDALVPFLTGLADRLRAQKVSIDFRALEYMNSATVIPILQFVRRLDSEGAQTHVLYDQKVSWQRINFRCMKTIARTLTHVEVHSEPPRSGVAKGTSS